MNKNAHVLSKNEHVLSKNEQKCALFAHFLHQFFRRGAVIRMTVPATVVLAMLTSLFLSSVVHSACPDPIDYGDENNGAALPVAFEL